MHCFVDVQTFPAPFHWRTYIKIATHTYRLTCNEHALFCGCSDLPSSIPLANIYQNSNTHIQTDMQRVCMHSLVDVQTFPAPFHGRTYATHIQTDMQRVCMHCLVDIQTFPAPFHGRTYAKLATHTYRLTCNECACTVMWMFRPSQLHSMGERMSN